MQARQARQVKRPVGVTVIAILNIIGSVLLGLIGLAGAGEIGDPGAAAVAGGFIVGISVFTIAMAVGLLRLRNWARITAIVLYGINALLGLIELLLGGPSGAVALGVALVILIYLNREHVREAFSGRNQMEITPSSPSTEVLGEQATKSESDVGLGTTP